ncbi:axoneme-associated protein mst101(2)-like isoform X2 [Branchiostoma lanceolatum]|uniref:axoneme-associated protein mst101(2)-like isoform X2 n=1 Tax=Branchiostoma lanceolatum TaxID=7740 RepID=UPI003453731E
MVPEGMLQSEGMSETMQKIVQMQLDIIREDYERVEEYESTYEEKMSMSTLESTADKSTKDGSKDVPTKTVEESVEVAKKETEAAEPAKKETEQSKKEPDTKAPEPSQKEPEKKVPEPSKKEPEKKAADVADKEPEKKETGSKASPATPVDSDTKDEKVLGAAAKKFGAKAEPAKKDEKPSGAKSGLGLKKGPAGAKPGEEFHFETSKEALTEAEKQKKKQKELEEMLKKALEEARIAEEEARRLAELEARRKREEEERKRREEEERKRKEEEERKKREEAERKRKEEEERKRREEEERKRREEEERRRKEEEERKKREEEERKRREEEERKRREEEEARRKKEEEEARRRREEEMKRKAEEEAKRKSQLADPSQRWQRLRDEKLGTDSASGTDPRLQRVRMREEASRRRTEDEQVTHATEQASRAAKLAARKTARERRARMPGRQPLVRSITNVAANEKVAREYLNYLLEDLNRRAPHQRIRAGAAMYDKDESRQYIPPALKTKDEFKRLNAKCKNEDSVDILLDDAIVDDVERKHRSSVIDRVLDFLKTHMPVPATEIILGGSIGQGTAAPSYAAVQIVILSDDFPKGGHEMWLPSAVVAYRKILEKAALEEGQLPDLTFVGHSQTTLQFMVEDVDVDMYFTREWGDTDHDYDHLYREAMMIRDTKARNCYAISAVRRQNAWVAGLPELVKDVVRMVKNWRNCVDWGEKKKRPNSYLLTLMVHKAYEEACRFTESIGDTPLEEDILREFINMTQKLDRAIGRVTWNDYYDPELYRVEHISRLPVVQDPAMPAFNVGETMESWNMMRHEAWIWGQSLGILKL